MFSIATRMHVAGLKGREITEFLAHADDEAYRRWWPGTHLRLHTVGGKAAGVGTLVFMDEFIGRRRIHMTGEVVAFVPGQKLVWQAKALFRWPVKLVLTLEDDDAGVWITHAIEAGYAGAGRLLDPLLRLWFSPAFAAAMDGHVRTEFPKLRDLLHPPRTASP